MNDPNVFPEPVDDCYPGIKLRDAFAMAALCGAMSKKYDALYAPTGETIARNCYNVADAMLAQRDESQ